MDITIYIEEKDINSLIDAAKDGSIMPNEAISYGYKRNVLQYVPITMSILSFNRLREMRYEKAYITTTEPDKEEPVIEPESLKIEEGNYYIASCNNITGYIILLKKIKVSTPSYEETHPYYAEFSTPTTYAGNGAFSEIERAATEEEIEIFNKAKKAYGK